MIFGQITDRMSDPQRQVRFSSRLPSSVSYASLERVAEELEHARSLFRRPGCLVVDVTDRAIEETAGIILDARKHRIQP